MLRSSTSKRKPGDKCKLHLMMGVIATVMNGGSRIYDVGLDGLHQIKAVYAVLRLFSTLEASITQKTNDKWLIR